MAVEAAILDTHRFIKRMTEVGIPENQAEVLVQTQAEFLGSNLATKGDLNELKNDLNALRDDLKGDVNVLRSDLNALRDDLNVLRSDVMKIESSLIKWMVGIACGLLASMFAMFSLFVGFSN